MSTVTGVISHIGEVVQASATIVKRDLVLTVQSGQYENLNAFELMNDKCSLTDSLTEGQEVTVHYNIRSREWNGRYFTNLIAWKIEQPQGQAQVPATQAPQAPQKQKAFTAPAPQRQYTAPAVEAEDDDLPF